MKTEKRLAWAALIAILATMGVLSNVRADTKISALPGAGPLAGTESIPAVQSGATVATTPAGINTYVQANTPTVTVAKGGTGATTLTGPLKGNGTSALSAAAAADIYGLWSGSCSISTFLRGDGACAAAPAGTVTSVALTAPTGLTVTGSPVTSSGTLDISTTLDGPVRGNGSGFITGTTDLETEVSGVLPVTNGGSGVATLTGLALGNGASPFSAYAGATCTNQFLRALSGAGSGTCATVSLTADVTGTLAVTHGGSGVATIVGPLKGNGTSAFSAAAAADIYGLWSGTCNASTFLRGDGACAAGNAGTVTSVALTVPGIFSVSGSPVTTNGTLAIDASGTSGGIPYFSGSTTLASSAVLTANAIVLGGGAGVTPAALGSLGTTTTLLHGNAAGAPTFGAVSLTADVTGVLPAANGGALGANPTASIDVTAVNGSATTYLRSDGAPALSQAIVPTWTGIHTWSLAEPRLLLSESDAGTNLKLWDLDLNAAILCIRTRTDADGAGVNALCATRGTTTAISDVSFGNATNNPTYSFLGTGTATFSGLVSALRVNVTNSSAPTVGIYRPGANRLGFACASVECGEFNATGQFIISLVGQGLSVKEGSNAKMGVSTLVAGTVVVSTTAVTASSRIFLTEQTLGTVAVPSAVGVSARTAGTSFTILASAPTDTSTVAWMLVEPSP